MTAVALDRRAPAPRLGRKIVSALLTAACAIALLTAVAHLKPASEWSAAPPAGDIAWATRLREAVWPRPILRADPADVVLAGRFVPADGDAPTVTFDGALIHLDGGETLRTRPWRIVAGGESYAADRTYARTLAAARDAQIELREIVPANDRTPASALPACGDRAPGFAALLTRGDRVDVMLFRAGAAPGPDAPAQAVCAIWSLARG